MRWAWLVLASLLVGGCALPLVSERELAAESERQFQQMRSQVPISTDARLRAYIDCITDAIVTQLEPPYNTREWTLEVFDSEEVNAFAMTGGLIGIYSGILKVAENQDQLAAVIGHEIAHVTQQHVLQRVNREMTTQGGVLVGTAVLGGGQAMADVLSMGAQLGLSLPYGRSQESEADTVGLRYMAAAGFQPQQSIELWKNMGRESRAGPPQFLSTHPSGENRIKDLISQLPEALTLYNEAQAAGRRPDCRR